MASENPKRVNSPTDSNTDMQSTHTGRRQRLLLSSFCFSPTGSMEERNGWHRAISAAERYDVRVMFCPTTPLHEIQSALPTNLRADALKLIPIPLQGFIKWLTCNDTTFYIAYRRWQRMVFRLAADLHREDPFDLTHLVSLCGYREPGYLWKLPVPHVWGPIGGTHNYPSSFLKDLDLPNALREITRSWVNNYQLKYCKRVKAAGRESAVVIAASTEAQRDLQRTLGIEIPVYLETGLSHQASSPRPSRDLSQPLRVLWAGRLRQWKALPILLHAIAKLPTDVKVQLRVLGTGSSLKSWKALAVRLGIAESIEWMPWVPYAQTLAHYEWADIFAFTSLRDTSGTGLLESLAAGAPILGVNHQGAADIMTKECAIPVPVKDWDSTVMGFVQGLIRLSKEPDFLKQLSLGATRRASEFHWQQNAANMHKIYQNLVQFKPVRFEPAPADMRSAQYANQPAL